MGRIRQDGGETQYPGLTCGFPFHFRCLITKQWLLFFFTFFSSFLFRCFISVRVLFLLPSCLLHPLDVCFLFFLTSCPEGKTGLTEVFCGGGYGCCIEVSPISAGKITFLEDGRCTCVGVGLYSNFNFSNVVDTDIAGGKEAEGV